MKAGLEFQSRARANTHDANDKNKFSFTYLLASIDVRVKNAQNVLEIVADNQSHDGVR